MLKKKIGILNFQYSEHNYGAVLQAAALEFTLKRLGYNAEHINFIPKNKFRLKSKLKDLLVRIKIIKPEVKNRYKNDVVFEDFRNSFLTRSKKIETEEQFHQLGEFYTAIVVGSDQVWRSKMTPNPATFFLKYVPNHVERIAYAVSFGAAKWELDKDDPITKMAKEETKRFKAISCRESSGVDICNDVFGVSGIHVLDPLLLVDDEFIEKVIENAKPSSSNLVYYKLGSDEDFKEELAALEKIYNSNAKNIYTRDDGSNEYEDVSQWMRNIYDSEVVITDSFHCICLGLRFGKEVIYYPNPERGQARLDDLFRLFSIKTEQLANGVLVSCVLSHDSADSFHLKISKMSDISRAFITSALN
jgi:hypothetical protein